MTEEDEGIIYHYYVSYDEERDDFYAQVDDGTKNADPIFTIDSTEEMLSYIKTKVMSHIDDVDGLAAFLKKQNFLKKNDVILLSETPILG